MVNSLFITQSSAGHSRPRTVIAAPFNWPSGRREVRLRVSPQHAGRLSILVVPKIFEPL